MRSGGLALVTVVFLGALARVWAPQAQGPAGGQPSTARASRGPNASEREKKSTATNPLGQWYPVTLEEKIRDFFGQKHSSDAPGLQPPCEVPDLDHWCVPQDERGKILFVIATVPDPVHTHLSLYFDRSIDSIEQGATSELYLFDRAIMPWRYSAGANSDETGDQAKLRESYPGLMIFRHEVKPPLFVFVAGETPTSGINEEQFHHAVEIIRAIRAGSGAAEASSGPEFGILGPTFSGSLYSLGVILNKYMNETSNAYVGRPLPVYATVTSASAIESFKEKAPNEVRMATFEQDATVTFTALYHYLVDGLHYKSFDIAVLNEDETEFGSRDSFDFHRVIGREADENIQILTFPRGISQLRSAYASEMQNAADDQAASGNQPQRSNLRLDLEMTGSDDDSVAPYAKAQTPLSQEGVMSAILTELRLREPKFILLRATDPLDELFLARYLRNRYPQGRLVVPNPDLLFARDEGGQLDGVLGLSTYPLSPAKLNSLCGPSPSLFPSAASAALFNATFALLMRLEGLAPQQSLQPVKVSRELNLTLQGESRKKPATTPSIRPAKTNGTGARLDLMSPCGLSPDLWLTIVSRNSLRPIKVLMSESWPSDIGAKTFASSNAHGTLEIYQRDTRIPTTWLLPYLLCWVLLGYHVRNSWTEGTLGQWLTPGQYNPAEPPFHRKATILWLGGIMLLGIYGAILSANTPPFYPAHGLDDPVAQAKAHCLEVLTSVVLWIPMGLFTGLVSWDFLKRRGERGLGWLFVGSAVIVTFAGVSYALAAESGMVLWQQRALDLTSGTSPVTPALLLLLALYCWFWYSLSGESLIDWRCPQLPGAKELPNRYYRLTDSAAQCILEVTRPFSAPLWVAGIAIAAVVCMALPALVGGPGHVPLRSLEGRSFDLAYSLLLGIALTTFVATLLRVIALWREFRLLLTALDRAGLKDALRRLSGFEWNTIWNPAWSVAKEGYKLVSRELHVIERLAASLGDPVSSDPEQIEGLRNRIQAILALRDELIGTVRGNAKCPTPSPSARLLMEPFRRIQRSFAEMAGFLCTSFLDVSWRNLPAENDPDRCDDKTAASTATEINVGTAVIKVGTAADADAPPVDPSGLAHDSLRLAEEFVACVYANFLVTVLLRVRGLVFSSVVMYVCIVFSTISYPFEPAPELSTLAIVLFLFSGATIGYVYEEMHRDPTLSRMTSTRPGQLDAAFWTKFVSTGIVPFTALVSTVYPPFGHLLYSFVGPLLQALR